jgi:hypothetical protein
MSTQPDPNTDDPAVPDAQLPQADRDKIRDIAKALVEGSLRMDADDFRALPLRIRRRAWLRYQAANEDRENVRERNARQRASVENQQATVEIARHAERLREDAEAERRRRPRVTTETSTAGAGTAAAFEMAVQHADESQPS